MKRLIVDTNILISALMKDSITREIILHFNGDLYSINFSKQEVKKYVGYILKKTKQSKESFEILLGTILDKIILLNDDVIMIKINEAKEIMDNIDSDDTPFVAGALAIGADIWSDDKHFQKQKVVKVWTTKELFEFYSL